MCMSVEGGHNSAELLSIKNRTEIEHPLAGAEQDRKLEKPARPFDMASGTVPDSGNVTPLQMLTVTPPQMFRVIRSGRAAGWLGGAFWGVVLVNAAPGTGSVIPDFSPAVF